MVGSIHMPPGGILMPQVGPHKSPALDTSFRISVYH
jgi:hypothetical protein